MNAAQHGRPVLVGHYGSKVVARLVVGLDRHLGDRLPQVVHDYQVDDAFRFDLNDQLAEIFKSGDALSFPPIAFGHHDELT